MSETRAIHDAVHALPSTTQPILVWVGERAEQQLPMLCQWQGQQYRTIPGGSPIDSAEIRYWMPATWPSEVMRVILPWPPSVNHYYRRAGHVMHVSQRGRDYKDHVRAMLRSNGSKMIDGPVGLRVECNAPDKRKRDLDNLFKSVLDSMKEQCFEDDSLIDDLSIVRLKPITNGRIIANVWSIQE